MYYVETRFLDVSVACELQPVIDRACVPTICFFSPPFFAPKICVINIKQESFSLLPVRRSTVLMQVETTADRPLATILQPCAPEVSGVSTRPWPSLTIISTKSSLI